jgi:hypothetical protein
MQFSGWRLRAGVFARVGPIRDHPAPGGRVVTWSEFGAGLAQSVIADLIVAGLLYWIIDKRLKLKQDRVRGAEFVRGILEMLRWN